MDFALLTLASRQNRFTFQFGKIDDLPPESEEELELDGESNDEAEREMVVVQRGKEPNEPANPAQAQAQRPETSTNNHEKSQLPLPDLDVIPSLINVVAEGEPNIRLPGCLNGRYESDPIFGPIVKNPSVFKYSIYENDLLNLKDASRLLLCIPDIKVGE